MFLLRPFKSKSIKNAWLVTYAILFMLPLILCLSLFLLVDGTIKEQVNNSNHFALKQIQQYMDTLVSDTKITAGNLVFNDRVQKIGGFKGELTPEERYEVILLSRDVVNRNYNPGIEEVYIYFRKIDTVVSSKHVMDSKSFFHLFAERYEINPEEWIRINKEDHKGSYENFSGTKLAYMLSSKDGAVTNCDINICVILDKSELLDMVKDIKIINSGKLAIIDKNDRIVLSSDNADILPKLKYSTFEKNNLVQYNNPVEGNKAEISYINSNVEKWKYLYIMPTREYWKKLNDYRILVIFGTFTCLIISCILAFFLFKKNYEPIKRLMKYLTGNNHSNKGALNEYKIIQNAILRSLDEKKELELWKTFQKQLSTEKYLKGLLAGNTSAHPPENNPVDIEFEGDYFSVTAFSVNSDNSFSILNPNSKEDFELLHFIIHNMLDELLQNLCRTYTVSMDSNIFCLMNFRNQDENNIQILKESVLKIQELVKEHYKVDLIITLGNIYEGIDFIKQSYKETLQLLEFEEVVGGEDILVYSESKDVLFSVSTYFYPMELEEALINAVKSGNFPRIRSLLEEIFNYNLNKLTLSSNIAQCLKCNIIGTLINTLDSIMNSNGEKYHHETLQIEKLIQCKSLIKVKEHLLPILRDVCEKINCDRKPANQIEQDVILFITENYKNDDLNVSTIADKFNLHPAYISKIFKQQVGVGLLDYINRVRISEAKKLIKSEKSNLESIAKKVGYSSIKTFTRAFSKIEGITPGKYREI